METRCEVLELQQDILHETTRPRMALMVGNWNMERHMRQPHIEAMEFAMAVVSRVMPGVMPPSSQKTSRGEDQDGVWGFGTMYMW